MHTRVVTVIPSKTVLEYGGVDRLLIYSLFRLVFYFCGFNFFSLSWQISALCNSISGSVTPWVQLSVANVMDVNVQTHDFRAITQTDPLYRTGYPWSGTLILGH